MAGSSGNDHLLFTRVAEGEEAAFDELFHTFLPRLYPFIIKFTRSELAAQEIIQETFIRVWMNRDKLSGIDNPGGWLFTVASNECYSYARKKALNDRLFVPMPETADATPSTDDPTRDWVDGKDLTRLISAAVEQLPTQRRKIYQMSRRDGKTIPQIAAELGLSPNTVKNTLVAALQSIREYLARYGVVFVALDLFLFQ